MTYQYRGALTIQAEEERQAKLKAELAKEREQYKEAVRIRRENERLEAEILRTRQRTAELAKPDTTLPTPIHGGRAGLRRAAEESAAYDRRKREQAA